VIEGFHWESVVSQIRASFGEQIEGCMPEWGPGQFEINLYRSDAISMADTAVIFKIAVKEIAAKAASRQRSWQSGMKTTQAAQGTSTKVCETPRQAGPCSMTRRDRTG